MGSWWRTHPMDQTLRGGVASPNRLSRARNASGQVAAQAKTRYRSRRAAGRARSLPIRRASGSGAIGDPRPYNLRPMPAAGPPPRFSLGRSLLFSTLLVAAFFALVEGVLRVAGVASPAEKPRILLREMDSDIILPFVRADRDVFWSPRPGYRGEFHGRPVTINALGLRGAELERPKPPGRPRGDCYGDSGTFGFRVGDDETYSRALGRRLAARGVDVANAGVTGFTSHQVLGLMRRLSPEIQADVVTVLVGWNDQNRRPLTDREYEARLRSARALEGP